MFFTILAGLDMDAAAFLSEVDRNICATTLRHIPAVGQFTADAATAQVEDTKKWLYGSAAAWVLGFAMMLAANDGIFFSNNLYKYDSPGVVLPGEPENIFEKQRDILLLKMQAKRLSFEEMSRDA
jgi:hypothetical protein